ncbi:hypothetical protein J4H86_06750 [Spiractinospora alimapuensis]|uniref:hypothetical protein n=1 Tax=Spiractinospora alimapuensis TaxID=2820884 RepID=UPI001F48036A|nr:hypothetical protein [Spiractinospora alimapuensis]QVQ53450.1 hypothetical protein J4H86_06750 [Spiractinospora alimapuensis]
MDPIVLRNRLILGIPLVLIIGGLLSLIFWTRDTATTDVPPGASADVPPLTELLPITEEAYVEAATLAIEHAGQYGTYSPGLSEDEFTDQLREGSDEYYQELLENNGTVASAYTRLADVDTATWPEVQILGVDDLAVDSIVFVVNVKAVPESDDEEVIDLGEFGFYLLRSGDTWQVHLVTQAIH